MDGGFEASAERLLEQNKDLAFAIKTAVGDFTVVSLDAVEAVNTPFEIRLELASSNASIDLHALIDSAACVAICSKYAPVRYLHGIVAEASRDDNGIRRCLYSLTLRPALHRLSLISDARIWQQMTPQAIVTQIFKEYGIEGVDWQLHEDYAKREYVTMLNETYLDFIERLLGEMGIFYYFSHEKDQHRLIFTDAPLGTPVLPHAKSLTYNANPGGQSRDFWVSRFSQQEKLRSNAYELNDYGFKSPAARYNQPWTRQESNGAADTYELYEYPGRYKDPLQVGKQIVRSRMQATRVDATTGHGTTNHIHLQPGYRFALTDHDDAKANTEHFLLSVRHSGQQPTALEEDAPDGAATTYKAEFTTMPGRLPYSPPVRPKPITDGPMVAKITGPPGEEIYTDEYARVKCHFYFDRRSKEDENSSCWIRVSQNWAGGSWGHLAIPRIGQEVIVTHIDGDIDQPIVIGRVYNGVQRPPVNLPKNKTRTVLKSQTHKGEGFNELSFEDQAGEEFIYMHAQKNLEVHVKNSRQKRVEFDDMATIGNNSMLAVAKDRIEKVDGNRDMTVSGNLSEKIDGDHGLMVGGALQAKAGGDFTFKSGGEIVLDASKITLVSGGTALVVSGGSVDVAPMINIGSASPGAAAIPPIPAVLEAAAGEGSPFVSHCPKAED